MQKKLVLLKKLLLIKKISNSEEESNYLIKSGKIKVNDQIINNPESFVNFSSKIEIINEENKQIKYVSRGGLKIEKAFIDFNLNVKNKKAVDIGASTGGFTDFLLRNGANLVTAIDVGYGLIDCKLKNDPRVILLEKTNIRHINKSSLQYLSDFTVVDVSFISIKKIFPKILEITKDGAEILLLFKPQFELEKKDVEPGGIIKKKELHIKALKDIISYLVNLKLKVEGLNFSKIKGTKGNIEFWIYLKKIFYDKKINDINNKEHKNNKEYKKNYDKIINTVVNNAYDYFELKKLNELN